MTGQPRPREAWAVDATGEAPPLGARLRERRQAQGLTLQAVAGGAGLTAGFISQVERGIAAPSLSSLSAIARVLGVDPGTLFAQPPSPGITTRHGARPVYGIDPRRLSYERISASFPGNQLRAVLIHEAPGHRSEPISHEGEEIFFILAGALTVELEGQVHRLEAGDSIHFASTRVHSTWNHTHDTTTVLHTCTMDVFGDETRARGHARGTTTNQRGQTPCHSDRDRR